MNFDRKEIEDAVEPMIAVVEVLAESKLPFLLAKTLRLTYMELVNQGFTSEEAMRIICSRDLMSSLNKK